MTCVLTVPYFICKLIRGVSYNLNLLKTEGSKCKYVCMYVCKYVSKYGVNLKFQFNTTLYTLHGVSHNEILSLLEVLAPFIKQ